MIDIGGSGTSITIIALQSFPIGFSVDQLSDDQDPLVGEEVEPTGFEPLYDGSLFFFDKTAAVKVHICVIPGSDDDINMKILLQARKGAATIIPLPDVTSMIISYPEGGVALSNGSIISGQLVDSIQSSGRKKGNVYTFAFGSFAGAQSPLQVVAAIGQAALSLL